MPIDGFICLVSLKYADEIHSDFVDCSGPDENGNRFLMISLAPYPAFSSNMLEYYPKNPTSIRRVTHPDFQFVCDELVDLDEWKRMPVSDDETQP